MTQKEKAKAYDLAIEAARCIYNNMKEGSNFSGMEDLEVIFPELAESEDEVIKKRIIHALHGDVLDMEETAKAIAWLEKQGKQKSIDDLTQQEAMDIAVANCFEQCKQKPFDYENVNIHQNDFTPKSAMEAIKEEKVDNQNCVKPTYKVEPKFHEGDWTVSNLDGKARQISEVHFDDYNSYYVVDGKSVNLEEYDRLHHLWTIEDAKPGDILATLDYILIFKGFLKNNGGISYCHYDFGAGNPQFVWFEDKNWYFCKEAIVHPATKEQHDLLFLKMKESGYIFDFEKKKLKKIEQKPTWSEEDEKILNEVILDLEVLKHRDSGEEGKAAYQKEIDWLKSLKSKNNWKHSD